MNMQCTKVITFLLSILLLFQQVCAVRLDGKQEAQMVATSFKTLATLVANSYENYSVDERKKALVGRALANVAHCATRLLDRKNVRDIPSKSLHGTQTLAQIVKQYDEYKMLKGRGQSNLLQKNYYGVRGRGVKAKKWAWNIVALIEWAASVCSIATQDKYKSWKHGVAEIVRAVSEFALQFGFGRYKSSNKKLEAVCNTIVGATSAYDGVKGALEFRKPSTGGGSGSAEGKDGDDLPPRDGAHVEGERKASLGEEEFEYAEVPDGQDGCVICTWGICTNARERNGEVELLCCAPRNGDPARWCHANCLNTWFTREREAIQGRVDEGLELRIAFDDLEANGLPIRDLMDRLENNRFRCPRGCQECRSR